MRHFDVMISRRDSGYQASTKLGEFDRPELGGFRQAAHDFVRSRIGQNDFELTFFSTQELREENEKCPRCGGSGRVWTDAPPAEYLLGLSGLMDESARGSENTCEVCGGSGLSVPNF